MTSILLDVDAALTVVSYLKASDTASLHAVNSKWHAFLAAHEEEVFRCHLRNDFVEGELLSFYAKEKGIPYRKLYYAFRKRWNVPQTEERLCFPWQRPFREDGWGKTGRRGGHSSYESMGGGGEEEDEGSESQSDGGEGDEGRGSTIAPTLKGADTSADSGLVFIGCVGNVDQPPVACFALKMESGFSHQVLVLDKDTMFQLPSLADLERKEDIPLVLPQNERVCEMLRTTDRDRYYDTDWLEDFTDAINGSYDLTLHVIDVHTYQVLSLPLKCGDGEARVDSCCDQCPVVVEPDYGFRDLYGLPPRHSPRWRVLNDDDFQRVWYGDPGPFERMLVSGELTMNFEDADEEDGVGVEISASADDLIFSFGGENCAIKRSHEVCCFLRAFMRKNCAPGEITTSSFVPMQQQPNWIQSGAVLDAIMKYSSFEDQAGKLRLVCHQFQSSALRQLEQKMNKTKVIGYYFDYEYRTRSFKASVRRGWSDDGLTSKASAVDDALALASCRCLYTRCDDKSSCPTASEPPKYSGYKVKSCTLDMEWARNELREKGLIQLDASNRIECSYEEEEMGIYQLCDKVEEIIRKNTRLDEEWEEEPDGLNEHVAQFYEVSSPMTSKQFVRSLFLVFAKAKAAVVDAGSEDGAVSKKARLASIEDVRVGFAKTNISGPDGTYSRMKQIYRFYSADHEPMEICLEGRDGCNEAE